MAPHHTDQTMARLDQNHGICEPECPGFDLSIAFPGDFFLDSKRDGFVGSPQKRTLYRIVTAGRIDPVYSIHQSSDLSS